MNRFRAEIFVRIGSKKHASNANENQNVKQQSLHVEERSRGNMERGPGNGQPSRPVLPAKHEYAGSQTDKFGEFDHEDIFFQAQHSWEVADKHDDADRDEQPRQNRDRNGTVRAMTILTK